MRDSANEYALNMRRDLTYIRRSTPALRKLTPEMCDDIDIITAIIKKHGAKLALQKASPRLKTDTFILAEAIKSDPSIFFTLEFEHQRKKEVLKAAIHNAVDPLDYILKYMLDDEQTILILIDICGDSFDVIPKNMKHILAVALAAVNKTAYALRWIDASLLQNRNIIITAAKSAKTMNCYELWQLIPDKFHSDPIVLDALNSRYFLPEILNNYYDANAAKWLVNRYPTFIKDMPMYSREEDVVFAAISKQGLYLVYADASLYSRHSFLSKLHSINFTTNLPKFGRAICEVYTFAKKIPMAIVLDICGICGMTYKS